MVSSIDICNMALGHLGRTAAPIQNFTESSVEARYCRLWYDISRQQVLEAQDWSFARGRAALALHADAPPDEWVYRYQAPADMLALRRLWNPWSEVPAPLYGFGGWPNVQAYGGTLGDAIPYQFETSLDGTQLTLLTNQDSAIAIYTRDVTLTSMFPTMFTNALSHYLAAKMAVGITSKPMMEDKEYKAFASAMGGAAASDANQGVSGPPRDATVIRSRM